MPWDVRRRGHSPRSRHGHPSMKSETNTTRSFRHQGWSQRDGQPVHRSHRTPGRGPLRQSSHTPSFQCSEGPRHRHPHPRFPVLRRGPLPAFPVFEGGPNAPMPTPTFQCSVGDQYDDVRHPHTLVPVCWWGPHRCTPPPFPVFCGVPHIETPTPISGDTRGPPTMPGPEAPRIRFPASPAVTRHGMPRVTNPASVVPSLSSHPPVCKMVLVVRCGCAANRRASYQITILIANSQQ